MSNRKRKRQRSPRSPPHSGRPPRPAEVVAAFDRLPRPEPRPPSDPAVVAAAVVEAVESGVVDAHLSVVSAAVRRRVRQLVRKVEVDAAARFEVGDRVHLGPGVRPKYLRGATATVAGWAHKNVLIRLEASAGRYRAGTEVSVSPLGVRRITS